MRHASRVRQLKAGKPEVTASIRRSGALDDDNGALRLVRMAADGRRVGLNVPDVFELHGKFRGDSARVWVVRAT
jgi:hypothetical protein